MRQFTILGLALGALCMVGLMVYATITLAHGNTAMPALLAAQSQNQALWAVDAAALYTLLLSASYYGQYARSRSAGDETVNLRDSHKAQLEAMIANAEKFEAVNAAQADEIADQIAQIATQHEQITTQQEQITTQQEQIAAQQEQMAVHTSEMTAMAAQIVTLQVENYTRADEITRQAHQNTAQTDQINELLSRITAQADQIAELTARSALQEQQIAEMADRTHAQTDQITIQSAQIVAQADQISEQVAQIAAQAESVRLLSTQNAALQAEIEARQEVYAINERHFTEQAFRAMAEQMDFNTRQIDTVNRMLQYHQAELQLLRYERLALQPAAEQSQITARVQGEMAAIAPGTPADVVRHIAASDDTPAKQNNPDGAGSEVKQPAPPSSGWQRKL